MRADRLNAFTDAVIAIALTLIVLEIPVPSAGPGGAPKHVLVMFGAYGLAFVNIVIFWNNLHQMMRDIRIIDARVLWANNALLFGITLNPFVFRWFGDVGMTAQPVAAYGVVMVLCTTAYTLLERAIVAADPDSPVKQAIGAGAKEFFSGGLYVAGIALAFVSPWISAVAYVIVAAMWFVPDRRFKQP